MATASRIGRENRGSHAKTYAARLVFPLAFAFAHRDLAAAAIFARAAALNLRFAFLGDSALFPFRFAHLAFCAAAIFRRPARDIFLRGLELADGDPTIPVPKIRLNSASSFSIFSLSAKARRSCEEVNAATNELCIGDRQTGFAE